MGIAPEYVYDHHLSAVTPFWMGALEGVPATVINVHSHAGFEVGIALSGTTETQFGDSSLTARAGDVWLCNMWEPHGARLTDPAGNAQVVLIFLPEFLTRDQHEAAPWLRLFTTAPEHRPRVESPETRARVLAIGRSLLDEFDQHSLRWEEMVRMELLRLLLILEREWREGPAAPTPRGTYAADLARIMPAVALVYAAPGRRVSCTEAAGVCGFSEPHFRLLFRRAVGVAFGGFSLRARLGYAAHHLIATDLTVGHIASDSGFAEASQFCRVFERHFGASPARYRDQTRRMGPTTRPAPVGDRQRATSTASVHRPVYPRAPGVHE